jgi:hypothetical protein
MEEIERAAKEAQEIIDKLEASNPLIHKMMHIVNKFLQHSKTMCYGGTAINNLLPKEKQFYDPEKDIPDYDFFTTTPQKHAKQIADMLVKEGIKNVEVKPGMHLGTFKVFADYTGVADVTNLENEVFDELWDERITKDNINYVPPNFLRMSVYLELSRPRGYVERWKKVYGRLRLLNEEYPIKCPIKDLKVHDEIITKDIEHKIENLLKKDDIILLGFNAAKIQSTGSHKWIFPLDLLVMPQHVNKVTNELLKILDTKNLKHESFHEYAEILPAHVDITHKSNLLVRIFETSACHSYHELQNKMKIASIPTLLNFFFAMIYADKEFIEHTSKERIICSAQELIDLADNAGKRKFKLLTPITCTGEQKDMLDMKKEKSELYTKLSTDKNSKAFLKYFFSYTPKPKHNFRGGNIVQSKMFPEKSGIDYSQLRITPEGEYSITKKHDSLKIVENMRKLCGSLKNKSIVDLTGNVGGDTIRFGMNFKYVESYELNPENFEALKNNVEVYNLDKKIKLFMGDSTKLYHTKKVDVLYMDPPWGGPDYKDKENLDLYLGSERIDLYLKDILEQTWRPNYIFLKLPSNYNFNRFIELPNIVEKISKFKIRGFYLVGIKVI